MPDIHGAFEAPTAEEVDLMEPRIKAFIFPSIPREPWEKKAFEKAVIHQIQHEKTIAAQLDGQTLPEGTTSFSIGNFSMSFDAGSGGGRLTKKTICPSAYGVLLEAGLLYKGVEGRLPATYEPD